MGINLLWGKQLLFFLKLLQTYNQIFGFKASTDFTSLKMLAPHSSRTMLNLTYVQKQTPLDEKAFRLVLWSWPLRFEGSAEPPLGRANLPAL